MGGFEGADHVNSQGRALAMNRATGHWDLIEEDYARLGEFGIRTVRESVGWRITSEEDPGLARLAQHARIAQQHGVQVIWTLHHYGLPAEVDFFAADFAARFADFCERVARCVVPHTEGAPIFQPINEISYLCWAVSSGELIRPHAGANPLLGGELKRRLVGAALRACDALWSVAPSARIVHTDPMIHVTGPEMGDEAQRLEAEQVCLAQFEAWDMISGRREPGLGGDPRYLDVIGVNYYHPNQWEHPSNERLHWHMADPRRRDPADMLQDLQRRYGRPVLIAETGHFGDGRAEWLDHVAGAAQLCEARGAPIEGICLYPVIDRHDWLEPSHWHRSGLWDMPDPVRRPELRVLDRSLARRLRQWQAVLPAPISQRPEAGSAEGIDLPTSEESVMNHLLVFSHLRWDFVYQRPQHVLSRLAARIGCEVIFVEEPVPGASQPHLERLDPAPGVRVLRPHLSGHAPGFHDDHIPALRKLLRDYLQAQKIDDYWLWFYTPMAMPLAAELTPAGIVYDCMDELSAFRNAPRQLLQRESALLREADLVFTGGRSLYEAKRERHARVHCFPSSVDAEHFSRAGRPPAIEPAAQADIGRPRLGFFGVVDERIDLDLLAALADTHPEWQIVMVGPVVKIDPAMLPRRANIHWLGQQAYAELPDFVAGWDVCLLPFALNEATRFISPTKTLEYLAADRATVSTPVKDVVDSYAHLVAIAETAAEFVHACEAALRATPQERERASALRAAALAGTSWECTVDAMALLIEERAAESALPSFAGPSAALASDASGPLDRVNGA